MFHRLWLGVFLVVYLATGCDAVRNVLQQNEGKNEKQTQLSTNPEGVTETLPPASDVNDADRTLIKGFDRFGQERSCEKISPQTACTMSFEPGDQFGADCREAGHEATQCGCHDYICSAKLK